MEFNHYGSTLRRALPLLLAATCSTDAEEIPIEHKVKASYLFNLLRFFQWPGDVCPPEGTLNLFIYGAGTLDAYYAWHGERVGNRKISVKRIKDLRAESNGECHLLVISGDQPVLSVPIARGLLTVGEGEGFNGRGGVVNLLLINGRIRFELNEEVAQACGFVVDRKLSKLKVPEWYTARLR